MRLRKPCQHGRYDAHREFGADFACPGGEFLTDDALDLGALAAALALYENPHFVILEVSPELRVIVDAARLVLDALTVGEDA